MERMHYIGLATLGLMIATSGAVFAQRTDKVVAGTVDGAPLEVRPVSSETARAVFAFQNHRSPAGPSDEKEVGRRQQELTCSRLQVAVGQVVLDEQIRRYGILVSEFEAREAWREELSHIDVDSWVGKIQAESAVIGAALTAVYEGDQDPEMVFQTSVAPHGIEKTAWQVYLEQGRSKEWRTNFAYRVRLTSAAMLGATNSAKPGLARRKLDAIIDRELSVPDYTFLLYLNELHASEVHNPDGTATLRMNADHLSYLRNNRDQWWKGKYAQLRVVLSDPTMAAACGLDTTGVRTAGSTGQ
jgi:hypothetical protein